MSFRTGTVPTTRATSALEQLHAELAGKLQTNKRETQRLTQAMKHVEAVLKLLQPGYDRHQAAEAKSVVQGAGRCFGTS